MAIRGEIFSSQVQTEKRTYFFNVKENRTGSHFLNLVESTKKPDGSFERHSIYARKLAKHGDLLTHDKDASAWHLLDMQSLIETNFVIVRSGNSLRDLVEVIQTSRRNIFPVLSDDDKFMGVVLLDDVRKIMFRADLYDKVTVDELMHPMSEGDIVRSSDSLTDVVEKFRVGDRYNLVVIDDDDNYLGFLSRANTFSAYRRFISDTSDE